MDELLANLEDGVRRQYQQLDNPALVGIRTGGVWLANRLHERLGLSEPIGELDISFYRDDFSRLGLNPRVRPSSLPFETQGRNIVLVDDVIMSGRTIRAAMNELFDYGRPARIVLATLLDLGARELPVQPDIAGQSLTLPRDKRLKLRGPDPLRVEAVTLSDARGGESDQ
nr:bifunctional pyr operon transcriptional regulator/uracil phosphoribosyltransferase PyrR [Tamilnaduibacter salinus]